MNYLSVFAFWSVVGYFLGSIPFGLVLTRLAGYGDIRKIGSGNIGATNVLRTGSKTLALLTVLLDAFKAGFAAWLAYHFTSDAEYYFLGYGSNVKVIASLIAGLFGILGHMFPVWLKFKGGKGISSSLGLLLMTCPVVGWIALAVWLVMAFLFRYSSLSALTAAVCVPFISYLNAPPVYTFFYTIVVILVIFKHHANIVRLLKGQESKISFKKKV
ncbi:MAG: glycerol-3-phosphate 1-O-acyltransferase PlsY [Alphaproteobacteria bacterium]|nr:glycerol-3-phosphate 1-O-acyltransferase PlsY [Alphaproteobacteria bacterium]